MKQFLFLLKGVLYVTVRLERFFFFEMKMSAHYINIVDLEIPIDRPQHQNIRERENELS